jgi:hypothetical protein
LLTATGNHLTGKLDIHPGTDPKQLDFLLSAGGRWLAIYSTAAKTTRLNYVEDEDGAKRPTQFVTSSDMRGTVIAMRRDE